MIVSLYEKRKIRKKKVIVEHSRMSEKCLNEYTGRNIIRRKKCYIHNKT